MTLLNECYPPGVDMCTFRFSSFQYGCRSHETKKCETLYRSDQNLLTLYMIITQQE